MVRPITINDSNPIGTGNAAGIGASVPPGPMTNPWIPFVEPASYRNLSLGVTTILVAAFSSGAVPALVRDPVFWSTAQLVITPLPASAMNKSWPEDPKRSAMPVKAFIGQSHGVKLLTCVGIPGSMINAPVA